MYAGKNKSQNISFCEIISGNTHSNKFLAGGQIIIKFARLLKTRKELCRIHDTTTAPKRLRKFIKNAYGK